MADDDEKPKKHTLETLFIIYANYKVVSTELENEEFDSIVLSQIDAWLEQAKLMPGTFSRVQTGFAYMRFKKWRLEFEDFLELLQQICNESQVNINEIKDAMVEAGVPSGGGDIVIVK